MKQENLRLIGVSDAALMLGLHPETVRRFARERRLPTRRVGGRWRFDPAELREWAAPAEDPPEAPLVLVVDDAPGVRAMLTHTLQKDGYNVQACATGEDALAFIEGIIPDLVLLDLVLPGIGGGEVLKHIRKRLGDVPVIIITGYHESDRMRDVLVHAPLIVLSKPVLPEQLKSAVDTVFGKHVSAELV